MVHFTQWSSDPRMRSPSTSWSASWTAIASASRGRGRRTAGGPAGPLEDQPRREEARRQTHAVARLLAPRLGAAQRGAGDEDVVEHALAAGTDRPQRRV